DQHAGGGGGAVGLLASTRPGHRDLRVVARPTQASSPGPHRVAPVRPEAHSNDKRERPAGGGRAEDRRRDATRLGGGGRSAARRRRPVSRRPAARATEDDTWAATVVVAPSRPI